MPCSTYHTMRCVRRHTHPTEKESARAIVGTLLCLLSLSTAATINTPERPPGHRVPRRPNGAKSPSPTPFGFKFIRVTLRQREIISHLSQPLSRIRAARLFSRCGAPPCAPFHHTYSQRRLASTTRGTTMEIVSTRITTGGVDMYERARPPRQTAENMKHSWKTWIFCMIIIITHLPICKTSPVAST